MNYKFSIYNLPIEIDGSNKRYIWNTKSGSIVSFDHEECELFNDENFCEELCKDKIDLLVKQGIIISEDIDEFFAVHFKSKQTQLNMDFANFMLVIAPTMGCNYKCNYCFENGIERCHEMSETTMEDIVKYIATIFSKHREIKHLDINWFGGEPLLVFESVIIPLSEKIIQLCVKYDISYQSRITTNGYFLTEDISKCLLEKCMVTIFQITFDGIEKSYYERKCAPKGAYERVKHNIFSLAKIIKENKYKALINIRINIDKENSGEAEMFANEIRNDIRYNDAINLYLGRLRSEIFNDSYLSLIEFEAVKQRFNAYIGKEERTKEPKQVWCKQYCMNSFCIGPYGEIYKCEHDFGNSQRIIGHIKEGLFYNKFFNDYMEMSVSEKCKTCKIYPICLGGCPHECFLNGIGYSCEYTEEYLKDLVRDYIKKRKS